MRIGSEHQQVLLPITQWSVRALHVYASLNRGGAETWLMDVVRKSSRDKLAIDVLATGRLPGAYEKEFLSLGGRIHRCPLGRNPWSFEKRLRKLLEEEHYDVVHSHLYYFSGIVLRAAAKAGVAQRIAHNHPVEDLKARGLLRGLYTGWMRRLMCKYGTDFVGPTRASMSGFWGPHWQQDSSKSVLYNGIDVRRFEKTADRAGVRSELGLPANAKIILNVSRFVPHKRQAFLVDVASSLIQRQSGVYFVCIGDGPTYDEVERKVQGAGLAGNFRFIRGLPSIDPYWLAADVFAFPSINEGFGIVVAEAAAAGLLVVACDIPGVQEAATACDRPILLPLDATADIWATAVEEALKRPALDSAMKEKMLQDFLFTIDASIEALTALYQRRRRLRGKT